MGTRRQVLNVLDAALIAGVKIDNVQQWCRDHGVNPRTFYRHRARIAAEGSWTERSRRPHHSPAATGAPLEAQILKLRTELGVDNGADYIRDALHDIATATRPGWQVPARSTINRVLDRHDLLDRNPKKRPRSAWRRFAYARPRDCYQIDATYLTLTNGRQVVVFDVIDDCTRQLVACHAAPAENTHAAITAISRAFTDYGPPALVLSDNGAAFTSRHRNTNAGPSQFAQHLHTTGTRLIHSSPYHPQTCGKVERHHQTLKHWLTARPRQPTTLPALQRLLDTYQQHYNHRRHSALPHRHTPHHAWNTAPEHGSPQHLPLQTDATVHQLRAGRTGHLHLGRARIGLGTTHNGQTFTVIRNGRHVTVYTLDGEPLGTAILDTTKRDYQRLTPTPV